MGIALTMAAAEPAYAEAGLQLGETLTTSRIIQTAVLITVLSVLPGLLVMVTSFTRLIIAFSFLRAGLGLQSTPANIVLISLSLFMTMYVMAPTFDVAWSSGVRPLLENRISEAEAAAKVVQPFKQFMLNNVREKDLAMLEELAPSSLKRQAGDVEVELRVLVPAFMMSELRRGFEIGLLIILPFLVIDMVGAILAMSMGMMMLPPTVITLPFKVLFFILIDGWTLIVGGLIRSFN